MREALRHARRRLELADVWKLMQAPIDDDGLELLGTLACAVAGDTPQRTVIAWLLDPQRLQRASLLEAEQAAREASILRWFALQYPGVAGVTIEKAAALEEAAAARVVHELRVEIDDPTIGRCRACGSRTAPWATLCDRCFMARGYKARALTQHELRAAEERHRAPVRVADRRVPELRRPAAVRELRLARDRRPSACVRRKFVFSSIVVNPVAPSGRLRMRAVAARGVGERDDGAGVQVAVRREVLLAHVEARVDDAVGDLAAPRSRAGRGRARRPPRSAVRA